MRDGPVAQQEAVVENERAVKPIENSSESCRNRSPAFSPPPEKLFPQPQDRQSKNGAGETREKELQDPRRPDGRAEHEPEHREAVWIERTGEVRVLLIPLLPVLRTPVRLLPREIRPPGGDVAPVPRREVRRPVHVSPLVGLCPEMPQRKRRPGQRDEVRPPREEDREKDRGKNGASTSDSGKHTGILGAYAFSKGRRATGGPSFIW